jgi:tetraacyldisaccharide 4'-kinase
MNALARRVERLMRGEAPRDFSDRLLAGVLGLASPAYAWGVGWRNRRFDADPSASAPVPEGARVVSVGNLTLGGSGKTPLTLALAEEFARRGRRVAIVLRGHGGRAAKEGRTIVVAKPGEPLDAARLDASEAGDEAILHALRLSGGQSGGAAVIVSRRRAPGVKLAVEELGCDAILLDDGFQHRAQARSADVLLWDASLPKEAYRLCPRGYLREPLQSAGRATAIAMEAASDTEAREKAHHLGLPWRQDQPALLYARSLSGVWRFLCGTTGGEVCFPQELGPFAMLQGERGFWFAGIARPERFEQSLRAEGLDLAGGAPLPDHEPFSGERVAELARQTGRVGAGYAIATEKDAAKLLGRWPAGAPPLWVARLEARLIDPDAWVRHGLGS